MNHADSRRSKPHRSRAFGAAVLRSALVVSILGAASCKSPPKSSEAESSAALSAFWSDADQSVHDAQKSLRSARQVARQLGGEAAVGNYEQIIATGHRVGGLGHDHATPADKVPVLQMLDSMNTSIESLTHVASTSAELEEAKRATDATVGQLSLRSQRLYHLLSAQKKVLSVRARASAIGFSSAQ